MAVASVRYIVDDLDAAIAFYTEHLGFSVDEDLDSLVAALGAAGAGFRNDVVVGRGDRQILLDDPAGNCVELFEPNPRSS